MTDVHMLAHGFPAGLLFFWLYKGYLGNHLSEQMTKLQEQKFMKTEFTYMEENIVIIFFKCKVIVTWFIHLILSLKCPTMIQAWY